MSHSANGNRQRHLLNFTSSLSPRAFTEKCEHLRYWYHSYYFDNGVEKRGIFDIARDLSAYRFPSDLTDLRVLDLGPAGGWFSVYFEQQGADVTCVDVKGYCDYDYFGHYAAPPLSAEKPKPDLVLDGREIYVSPSGQSFWLMRELLGLKARFVNARVYDLDPRLFGGSSFDLVFLGCVLMHLRDPVRALQAVRSVCRGSIIASTYCDPSLCPDEPVMALRSWTPILWWVPNPKCLVRWFEAASFRDVKLSEDLPLSVDLPFVDEQNVSHGENQHLWRVQASV